MTCDEWRAFTHDYVFGDLHAPARELLDGHAASCASCLGEARLLKFVDQRLREEPTLTPPPGLARRALEEAPARPGRELWRIAAALLLAGGIGAASASSDFTRQLPDDVRRAPRYFSEAAQEIPSFFGAIHVP